MLRILKLKSITISELQKTLKFFYSSFFSMKGNDLYIVIFGALGTFAGIYEIIKYLLTAKLINVILITTGIEYFFRFSRKNQFDTMIGTLPITLFGILMSFKKVIDSKMFNSCLNVMKNILNNNLVNILTIIFTKILYLLKNIIKHKKGMVEFFTKLLQYTKSETIIKNKNVIIKIFNKLLTFMKNKNFFKHAILIALNIIAFFIHCESHIKVTFLPLNPWETDEYKEIYKGIDFNI